MNTFLTIMCLALVASATAIQSGYNYQQPKLQVKQQAAPQFVAPAPQYAAPIQQQFAAPASQYAAPVQQQFVAPAPQYAAPVEQQFNAPAPQYIAPVQQQYSAPAPVSQYQPTYHQPQQQQTIISKDIFIHSAPEETEEIGADQGVEAGPNRKNYRIVFIKAPAQNLKLNLNSLKRAQSSNEEKTVIYVLSKKPDLGNIQSQLASVHTEQKAHKPEVYFIKYKTQEEANRAQQEIQAQYDSLGGSTHISDEGIAPVTSVIGGGRVNVGSVGPSFTGGNAGSIGTSFTGGNAGSVGTSFTGGNAGSSGSSFTGGNAGSFNGGNNFVQTFGGAQQQQQFSQQSFQSNQGSSSVSFGGVPSEKYLPASKK